MKINIKDIKFHYFLLGALLFVFLLAEYHRVGDFGFYYEASTDFLNGENIYQKLYVDGLFWYFGSPVLTYLMVPFTFFSAKIAAIIFGCVSIAAIIRSLVIIDFFITSRAKNRLQIKFFWLSVFCLSFPIYSHFHFQQFTIVTMYLGLESIYQEKIKNKQLFAGFLIAFGLFIKLYTIVLIPYFLYRGKFKPVIYSGAFAFLSISATYLIFDIEYVNQLWKGWISQISKNEWDYLLEIEMENNHGIGTLISSLFIVDLPKEAVPVRNHIIELSKENVYIIICTAKVVLISFTLYFIRTLPFKQAKDKRYFAWEISYLFLVIPLIFPQQRPYNFVLLLPAIYYILTYVNLHQKKYVVALLIVSVVLINLELWLGEFREYYTHFKTLTYGSLGLLITLSLSKPAKSSKELTLNE